MTLPLWIEARDLKICAAVDHLDDSVFPAIIVKFDGAGTSLVGLSSAY